MKWKRLQHSYNILLFAENIVNRLHILGNTTITISHPYLLHVYFGKLICDVSYAIYNVKI